MNTKLAAIAFATALTATTASAIELQPLQQQQQNGEYSPVLFGSTVTYDNANAKPRPANAFMAQRRALNVQIRTVQRQYLNAKRAGDPRAAQLKVELERLKEQQRTLNRSIRAR